MFYKQPEFLPKEVICYLRKSRSDDPLLSVEEVLSKHEIILDEWAENYMGAKVPEENKFREVVSGETLKERPEINKVLRLIESPKHKGVAVVEPQRLTRGDLEDIGRVMKLFKHTNTLIITPQRIYDLQDEYDWDAFERELKRGNDYLEYTKKILNRGRLLSVSQGNYLGTLPPYGYDKTWVMSGKRKCPTLKENKEQADVMRMIFDMYVNQDMGRAKICRKLDEMAIKPPRGEHWSPEALKDMLENVHYIGKVKWNWRKTVTIVENSEIIKTRPKARMGEFLIYDGKHEGIIPEELFNAAQEKRGLNHRAKATTKVRNPFSGILFCSCGRAMILRFNRKNGIERAAPRLMCSDQVHCHSGSCLYSEMVEKIDEALTNCIKDFEIKIKNNTENTAKYHAQLIKNLERKLKDLETKEVLQWELQSDPDPEKRMPQEIFKKLSAKLSKEKEETKEALFRAYKTAPEPVNYEEKVKAFRDALTALKNPDVSAEKKNKLLKRCIVRIEYYRDKPERVKCVSGKWSNPPIDLDIKLKI